MPTDLQASSSSTSSMCKQGSLEDSSSNGLDKSKDEASLSRELYFTFLSNGNHHNSSTCCTPIMLTCTLKDDINDTGSQDRCRVICSNSKCDQSGWIHLNCVKAWDQCVRSELLKLSPQVRSVLERKASATVNSSSSMSSLSNNGWLEMLQSALPGLYKCRCQNGTLMRLEQNNTSNQQQQESNVMNRRKITAQQPNSSFANAHQQKQPYQNLSLTSGFSSSGFGYGSGNNRKNSLEMSPSTSFNSFNKRMRSRTVSANQMVANENGLITASVPPYDFVLSKKDNNTSGNSGKSNLGSNSSNNNNSNKQGQPINGLIKSNKSHNNRQRHHSSCYHGSSNSFKDEFRGASPPTPNSAGNIFKQRSNFKSFQKLPFSKQNAYFIQMEDDSCTGNDDTKVYLLTLLSQQARNTVNCLVCGQNMPVYDHLPLIDGTFFVSPVCHSQNRAVPIPAFIGGPPGTFNQVMTSNNNSNNNNGYNNTGATSGGNNKGDDKYLHAVCCNCMHEIVVCCQTCHRPWTGAQLLVGSLYTYDIFAAVPCCASRLSCNKCSQICVYPGGTQNKAGTQCDTGTLANTGTESTGNKTASSSSPTLTTLLSNFSQLSRSIECVHCHARDYHFVKPFAEVYKPIGYVQ